VLVHFQLASVITNELELHSVHPGAPVVVTWISAMNPAGPASFVVFAANTTVAAGAREIENC
jgi:hypothetical protein